jgi:hypothetical protein
LDIRSKGYTDEIHTAVLTLYTDPYERIAAAVIALAIKDAGRHHPQARDWLARQGKSWLAALGLDPRSFM